MLNTAEWYMHIGCGDTVYINIYIYTWSLYLQLNLSIAPLHVHTALSSYIFMTYTLLFSSHHSSKQSTSECNRSGCKCYSNLCVLGDPTRHSPQQPPHWVCHYLLRFIFPWRWRWNAIYHHGSNSVDCYTCQSWAIFTLWCWGSSCKRCWSWPSQPWGYHWNSQSKSVLWEIEMQIDHMSTPTGFITLPEHLFLWTLLFIDFAVYGSALW